MSTPFIQSAHEFKALIRGLQTTLINKNQDLRTLGFLKALHSASEGLGYKNWNQLQSLFTEAEFKRCLRQNYQLQDAVIESAWVGVKDVKTDASGEELAVEYANIAQILPKSSDATEGTTVTPAFYEHSVEIFIMTEVELGQNGEEPVIDTRIFDTDKQRLLHLKGSIKEKMMARGLDDIRDLAGIDLPSENDVDNLQDEEEVIDWIIEQNGEVALSSLYSELDYGLSVLTLESQYVDVTSSVPNTTSQTSVTPAQPERKTSPFFVHIHWGDANTRKDNPEIMEYEFGSQGEMDAFMAGVDEAIEHFPGECEPDEDTLSGFATDGAQHEYLHALAQADGFSDYIIVRRSDWEEELE